MTVNYLAYTDISAYKPTIGDFVIWQGWFKTWYGVVIGITDSKIIMAFEGTPKLLFTSNEEMLSKISYSFSLEEIRNKKTKYLYIFDGKLWYQ